MADRQIVMFDLDAALDKRDRILKVMEEKDPSWVQVARSVAKDIARLKGTVTADDVRKVMISRKLEPRHYNSWGSVFRSAEFEWTGEYSRSAVVKGKGNMQRVWRLPRRE